MKRKIIVILTLCLLVFGLSFYIGKNNLFHDVDNALDKEENNNVEEKNLEENPTLDNSSSSNQNIDDSNVEDNPISSDEKNTNDLQSNTTDTKTNQNTTNNNTKTNKNTTVSKDNSTSKNTSSENNNTNNSANKTEEKEEKKIVNTEKNVTELEFKYEKYGTKFYSVNYYNIYTYNDGTKEKEFLFTLSTKMDTSGYNGTVSSMLEEAKSTVEKNKKEYEKLLDIVNGYREEKGVAPLELDDKLTLLATIRAMEMAYYNNMSHVRPKGGYYNDIFKELNIPSPFASAENIAAGQANAESAAKSWRNSKDGHYESMINSTYKKVGLGMFKLEGSGYGTYWAQVFTS